VVGAASSGRRRAQSTTTSVTVQGGVNTGSITINTGTIALKLDKNDGPITIASGVTGTVELGSTSTVTTLSGDGASSVTVTQFTSTNPLVTGTGTGNGTGNTPTTTASGGDDAPCFDRDQTTACRLLDASLAPTAAFSRCFGDSPTEGAERVLMADLVAGDLVLSDASTTTRVVVNQHVPEPAVTAHLLTLEHATGSLSLTPDHVIFVDGSFLPARAASPGSTLSGGAVVMRVSHGHGAVINPITASGKILAAGLNGTPVVAATANEWAADALLSPFAAYSLAFAFSAAFPQRVQEYYDAALEPIFNAAVPHLARTKASSSTPFVVTCFALGDALLALGFVAFSLTKPTVALTSAAVLFAAGRRAK